MKDVDLSFEEFEARLREEYNYFLNGGTDYRKQTAKLSLEIALKTNAIEPFFEQETSENIVDKLYPNLDQERKDDVAKFLRVIANNLLFHASLPSEVKEYVEEKMNNTKITIKKVKE